MTDLENLTRLEGGKERRKNQGGGSEKRNEAQTSERE